MKVYYIVVNNQQEGPFTFEELKEKHLNATTLVWSEGMETWEPASSFYELKKYLSSKQIPPVIALDSRKKSTEKLPKMVLFFRSIVWTNKKVLGVIALFSVFIISFAWLITSNTQLRIQKQSLVSEQIKNEQVLHDRIQAQEKYYNEQMDQLNLRMLQQEQQQQSRHEEERKLLDEIQQEKFNTELELAHKNVTKAKDYLVEISRFQLFRTSSEREQDIHRASENLRFAEEEFNRLQERKVAGESSR